MQHLITGCLVVLLVLVPEPFGARANDAVVAYKGSIPEIAALAGRGRMTTPAFEAPEGDLTIAFSHGTEDATGYMQITIQADNNGDGVFCGEGDSGCGMLWQGAYEAIKDANRTETATFFGGSARYVVDAPGRWTIATTVKPRPLHVLAGSVRQPVIVDGRVYTNTTMSDYPLISAVSNRGERFETRGDQFGEYKLRVYGDTGYRIVSSKPSKGVAPSLEAQAKSISANIFSGLGNPAWPVVTDFELKVKPERQTIHITPLNRLRLEGVKLLPPIRIAPQQPLRLQGAKPAPISISPTKPLRLEGFGKESEEEPR